MTTRSELEAKSREVAELIASGLPPGIGFALLLFNFGEGGNLAWISNAERDDMLQALREFLQKVTIS